MPVSTRTVTPATSTAKEHHAYLKWPRLIAFTLVGAISVAALGLAARAIINLNHDRKTLATLVPGGKIHAANVVACTALMVTVGGIAALYCTGLSAAILFGLHREETRTSIRVKEACMAILAVLLLGTVIAATIIIVPRSAGVSAPGIPSAVLKQVVESTGKSLKYRDTLAFPALICVWICFGLVLIAFLLAALASRHIAKHGPEETVAFGSHGQSSSSSHATKSKDVAGHSSKEGSGAAALAAHEKTKGGLTGTESNTTATTGTTAVNGVGQGQGHGKEGGLNEKSGLVGAGAGAGLAGAGAGLAHETNGLGDVNGHGHGHGLGTDKDAHKAYTTEKEYASTTGDATGLGATTATTDSGTGTTGLTGAGHNTHGAGVGAGAGHDGLTGTGTGLTGTDGTGLNSTNQTNDGYDTSAVISHLVSSGSHTLGLGSGDNSASVAGGTLSQSLDGLKMYPKESTA